MFLYVIFGLDRLGVNLVYLFFFFNIVEMKNYMFLIFLRFDIWFIYVSDVDSVVLSLVLGIYYFNFDN